MATLTKEQIEAKNQDPVDADAVEVPDNELEKAAGGITYSFPGIVPDQNLPV